MQLIYNSNYNKINTLMQTLSIDIETYSSLDLAKVGVYKYACDPYFEILLLAYAFDSQEVKVLDLANGQSLDKEFIDALISPSVVKTAFNANFERVCLNKYLGIEIPINQWECTMVKAQLLALPSSLAMAAQALGLEQSKMEEGKKLIKYFCMPCKATKANGGTERNLPTGDTHKWDLFKEYCKQDVVTERALKERLSFFKAPSWEKEIYVLDQKINDRGIKLDASFVNAARELDSLHSSKLLEQAKDLTSLENPNSTQQLKAWLEAELGSQVTSLTKKDSSHLLSISSSGKAKQALALRQEMAKTSIKKYEAMAKVICQDHRARGLLQYYGASRTGRWAGRLVQVQNLPQNHLKDLSLARELVNNKDIQMLELLFGSLPDTLSQLIRTSFIADRGHSFIVADFAAIEARVIAWLAREQWRMEVFSSHGKIYEASAAAMFGVPLEDVSKAMRQKGKIAELALGYQGGVGALLSMGALNMGLKEEELPSIVNAWRGANKKIVGLWGQVQRAALTAIETLREQKIAWGISFRYDSNNKILFITLPSSRALSYQQPQIAINRFGSKALKYLGMSQATRTWCWQESYGGKLVENIVQAIARDCLAEAMMALDKAGYKIVMHVHDEVVIEIQEAQAQQGLQEVQEILSKKLHWGEGLELKATGYITPYYKKD